MAKTAQYRIDLPDGSVEFASSLKEAEAIEAKAMAARQVRNPSPNEHLRRGAMRYGAASREVRDGDLNQGIALAFQAESDFDDGGDRSAAEDAHSLGLSGLSARRNPATYPVFVQLRSALGTAIGGRQLIAGAARTAAEAKAEAKRDGYQVIKVSKTYTPEVDGLCFLVIARSKSRNPSTTPSEAVADTYTFLSDYVRTTTDHLYAQRDGRGQIQVWDHAHDRVFVLDGNAHPLFVWVRQFVDSTTGGGGTMVPEKWAHLKPDVNTIVDYLLAESKKPKSLPVHNPDWAKIRERAAHYGRQAGKAAAKGARKAAAGAKAAAPLLAHGAREFGVHAAKAASAAGRAAAKQNPKRKRRNGESC